MEMHELVIEMKLPEINALPLCNLVLRQAPLVAA